MCCWRQVISTSIIAAVAVSMLAAGCGGGSSSTAAMTTQNGPLAYAHCMRAHGVPGFPDPTGEGDKRAVVSALKAVSGSQAQAAERACLHVNGGSPGSGQSAAQSQARAAVLLAFARCMRTHGFPSFPDPASDGQLTRHMLTHAGIDLGQPALLADADTCVGVTHGTLTTAAVARFVAGR
jgi:hypothetical protein